MVSTTWHRLGVTSAKCGKCKEGAAAVSILFYTMLCRFFGGVVMPNSFLSALVLARTGFCAAALVRAHFALITLSLYLGRRG